MKQVKSEDQKLKEILIRFNQLDSNRSRFTPRWSEAQNYVASTVTNWSDLDALPEVPNRYSSIPCNYLKTLVNGLIGYSISPNILWFKLGLENDNQLNLYGVKDFLEKCEAAMYAEFNRSNLYAEAVQFCTDAATIGHGVLKCGEDLEANKLHFEKLPAAEVYLDINYKSEVDTVYRRFLMTIRDCINFFGEENCTEEIREEYKEIENWNTKIEILEAVFPREDFNPDFPDAKNKPYAAVYVDKTHNKIILESGYDELPYAIFQWERIPGYAYSTSPAQSAITDIKALNIIKKTSLEIAQISAEPPIIASEDVRQISIRPNGITRVSSPDQRIEPLKLGENYPITLQVLQDNKQDLRDWFYVDFFLMLQQQQGRPMTATQVMEMQGEKAATLSNLIVNLNYALTKIIQRSFNLLMKEGKLPPVPASLEGMQATMKVDFIGPLAQAQKKYHTIGGTASAIQIAAPIMQMFPNAGDFIDADELIKSALEGQGMPQNVIREDDDVKKLREERIAQQQAQQQQAQQMEVLGQVMQNADKLGQTPEQGSIMRDLNDQLSGGMANG